jgi:hypothetical protein
MKTSLRKDEEKKQSRDSISQYKFCKNCNQLCPLRIEAGPKGGYLLIDACKFCGKKNEIDNKKCYSIKL